MPGLIVASLQQDDIDHTKIETENGGSY